MESYIFVVSLLVFQNFQSSFVSGGLAPTWYDCECFWDPWKPWSECNSTCYGMRVRRRSVWLTNYEGCDEFTDCATRDMGSEYEGCNKACANGGIYDGLSCVCPDGFYGDCCNDQVTCGSPSALTNGNLIGSSYTYGSSIIYTCNANYNLTGGNAVRTCQLDSMWSGNKPRCGYINSCSSTPCLNGATCTDIIDGYLCNCQPGWSGKICEKDIQPPIAENCTNGINITTEARIESVSWTPPAFTDPMGHGVYTHTNYPQHSFEFPWGDFQVQYTALKPSNGLSEECLFDVRVRPNPCPMLEVRINGARVCNNWKTDYGLFCLVFCVGNNTLSRGKSFGDWFVCGSSGNWMPSSTMPGCVSHTSDSKSTNQFGIGSCSNKTDISAVQRKYIEFLKLSDFRYFCDQFSNLCLEENVSVTC